MGNSSPPKITRMRFPSSNKPMNIKLLAAAPIVLFSLDVRAAPSRYECPQSIPESSIGVTHPIGWRPFVSSPLYLSNAAPADGPPERLGVLRGGEVKPQKNGWTQKFSLAGPYPEGKWLRCDYGQGGNISLSMRLPDAIQACTVMGKKGVHADENIIEVVCK
jgi:hypothetical protein